MFSLKRKSTTRAQKQKIGKNYRWFLISEFFNWLDFAKRKYVALYFSPRGICTDVCEKKWKSQLERPPLNKFRSLCVYVTIKHNKNYSAQMATANHFFLFEFFFLWFAHAQAHVCSRSVFTVHSRTDMMKKGKKKNCKINQQTFNWNFSQKWFVVFPRNTSRWYCSICSTSASFNMILSHRI